MKNLLPLLFLLFFIKIQAQQINSCGGSTQGTEFSAEWIIGGSLIDNSVLSIGNENFTGINELIDYEVIEIYPTITRDFLSIARKGNNVKPINFIIANDSGIAYQTGKLEGTNTSKLDLNELAPGLYLIIFSSPDDKNFMVSKKFIKQ